MTRTTDAESIAATFGELLLRANRVHLYRGLVGDETGVDETTYPVLSGLGRLGSATATELATQIGLDRTVTTRYAARLEEAGLVGRRAHPNDARASVLVLTRRGRTSLDVMRGRLNDLVVSVTEGWSASELRTFTGQFGQLAAGLAAPADGDGVRQSERRAPLTTR